MYQEICVFIICNNGVLSLSTHEMQMACTDKTHTRYWCWLLVVVIPTDNMLDSKCKILKKVFGFQSLKNSKCFIIEKQPRNIARLEISNLSLIFSKSIMQHKIWVFVYGIWEQEFSARRRKHTTNTHHANAFCSWLCTTI